MTCAKCGKEPLPEDKYCSQCGEMVTKTAPPEEAAPAKTKSEKLKVLVIDDDYMFLESYLFKFDKEGFDVVLARNGQEGLRAARKEKPSAILLDILMPVGMNGLEVLRQLKKDPKTRAIPVVLVTILNDKEAEEQGLALGAAGYVKKDSMTADSVVEAIRDAALGTKNTAK